MTSNLFCRTAAAFLLVAGCTATSSANEIANGYKCVAGSSPEKVIRAMVDRGVVVASPFEVADAVHSYSAKPGFTAFGFPLVAVSGWQENSTFFGRGPGTAPPVHFSFVIRASRWQLAKAVGLYGNKFVQQGLDHPYPHVRVESFNSEVSDRLPPGANAQFAYAQVSCHPRI
jgi:hypothetical protein